MNAMLEVFNPKIAHKIFMLYFTSINVSEGCIKPSAIFSNAIFILYFNLSDAVVTKSTPY